MLLLCFNRPPATEICTLSLHDALPIWPADGEMHDLRGGVVVVFAHQPVPLERQRADRTLVDPGKAVQFEPGRSEEHTSELQSRLQLVCRLLLETKNTPSSTHSSTDNNP